MTNTGRVASEEDRRRMDEAIRGDSQDGAHLGMANISMRLQLIYGGCAVMAVETDEPGRTRVTLDVPQEGGLTR